MAFLDRWRNPVLVANGVAETTRQDIRDNGRDIDKLKTHLDVQNRLARDAAGEGKMDKLREISEVIALKEEELQQAQVMRRNLINSQQHTNRLVNTTKLSNTMKKQINLTHRLEHMMKVRGSSSSIVAAFEKSQDVITNLSEDQEMLSSTNTNIQHSMAAKSQAIMNEIMRDCNVLPSAVPNNGINAVNNPTPVLEQPQGTR